MSRPRSSVVTLARIVFGCWFAILAPAGALGQDVQVIRSTGPGAWGERLRVVEEVRIGQVEGAEEYLFGDVNGVAGSPDGTTFVAEGQGALARVYDAQGRFLRNVGRPGEGPGEFRAVDFIRVLSDGRVAVWDHQLGRVSIFGSDGAFQTSVRVPSGGRVVIDHTGQSFVWTPIRASRGAPVTGEAWVRVSTRGAVLDSLVVPSDPNRPESFVITSPQGRDAPFTPERVTTVSRAGYMVTGLNAMYAFDQLLPDGRVRRIERASTPERVMGEERAEWEAWADYMERKLANPTSSNPNVLLPPSRRVSYPIPETKPAYKDLLTDSEGRIWVQRYVRAQRSPDPRRPATDTRPARVWREPPTFDVFEPDGRFLGTVALPLDSRMFDARGRQVWATVRGEFDETYVVRYTVESVPQ